MQLPVIAFTSSALLLALLFWKGGRGLRLLCLPFVCIWLYQAQWYGRGFINARWVDDARSHYQQDKVVEAIEQGKTRIPLKDTTNFEWSAVCHVWAEPPYSPAWTDEQKQKVFGTTYIPYFEKGGGGEHFVLVYATPEGAYVMEPGWQGRLTREFQTRRMGQYYAQRLGGRGYSVEEKMNETEDNLLGPLCFKPEDVWFEITPEPPWTDDVSAWIERTIKQGKAP